MTTGARTWTALLAVGLLLVVALPAPVSPQSGATTATIEWWDTTQVGSGFHIRVPITVTNTATHPVDNGAVLVEIDITKELLAAGWVGRSRGGQDQLASFELDPHSVRVVAITDPAAASQAGRLRAYDPSLAVSDLARFEVPSTYVEGLVSEVVRSFDPRTNPGITVLWHIPGVLQPGAKQHFAVYFDSLTNNDHPATDYRGYRGADLMAGSFGPGPSQHLVGLVAPPSGQPGVVSIIGLHAGTQVRVQVATGAGQQFTDWVPPNPQQNNPLSVGQGQIVDILASNQPSLVRLLADKPILAQASSEGFVPASNGGFSAAEGESFLFSTLYPASSLQNGLHFINLHPDPTNPGAATVIRLERMGGETRTFGLSDSSNQFPYTTGGHASDQPTRVGNNCVFPDQGSPQLVIPAGQAKYRAEVVSGGPVALQYQPVLGVTPLPAPGQGPTGTEFWSVLSRSTATLQSGQCLIQTQPHSFYAASPTSNFIAIVRPEPDAPRLYPVCNAASPPTCVPLGQPVGPLGQTLTMATTQSGDLRDHPLRVTAQEPLWFMAGIGANSMGATQLRGPLPGADGGRDFAGFGPTILYAPYGGTVQARMDTTTGSDVPRTVSLGGAGTLTQLVDAAGQPPRWYLLESDRPIIALPTGASSGFFAGVPTLFDAALGPAEFRGHLVELKSPTGLNPVTASTVPGTPVEYTFQVTNRGRGIGGANLLDTITVCPGTAPPGWSASFGAGDGGCTSFTLQSGQTRVVQLKVTPPPHADPGVLAVVPVRATSQSNPAVFDTAEAVTHIKRAFDVGLWFDNVGGPKSREAIASDVQAAQYTLVVQNRGTVADTVRVSLEPLGLEDATWTALLDGQTEAVLDLAPLEVRQLQFRVDPPDGVLEGLLIVPLTAQSLSEAAVLDRATAITRVRAPSDLALETLATTVWVGPGGEAVFESILRNRGDGTAEVLLQVQGETLPGWSAPTVFLQGAGETGRVPLERISVSPGDTVRLAINITAPADALAGNRTALLFNAVTPQGEGDGEFLHAIVRAEHVLTAELPPLPLPVGRADALPIELRLTNQGNLDELLRTGVASLPPGWNLTFPDDEVFVPRNETQIVEITLQVPAGTPPGEHDVVLTFTSHDGNLTEVSMPVLVRSFSASAVDGQGRLLAQPGRAAWTQYHFSNDGNSPLTVRVERADGEAWPTRGAAAVEVPPRAQVTIPVGWDVPRTAADGASSHQAVLVSEPTLPGLDVERRTVTTEIVVGRPDLRVVEASAFAGAAGDIVRVLVANQGTRAAYDVDLVLQVDGEVVDRIAIAEVPVGSMRNATFLQPENRPGAATVVIDPEGTIVESDRSNNLLAVTARSDQEAPLPGAWILAVVLLGLAWGRRRGGRGPIGPE